MDSKTLWLNIVGDLHDCSSTTLGDRLTLLVYKEITDLLCCCYFLFYFIGMMQMTLHPLFMKQMKKKVIT